MHQCLYCDNVDVIEEYAVAPDRPQVTVYIVVCPVCREVYKRRDIVRGKVTMKRELAELGKRWHAKHEARQRAMQEALAPLYAEIDMEREEQARKLQAERDKDPEAAAEHERKVQEALLKYS